MTSPVAGPPSDEATRRRIVEEVDRSCLVEASAGTGKTSLLVRRILSLFRRGVAPEGLVAITFTEKAAAELFGRLRDELQRAARDPLDPAAGLLAAALKDLDRATVTTIHSFCSRLLHEYPVPAGLSPGFTVLDAVATRRLFDETWDLWLGAQLEELNGALRVPLVYGARLDGGQKTIGLRELARALYDQRDLLPRFRAAAGDPRALRRQALLGLVEGLAARVAAVGPLLGACRAPVEDRAYLAVSPALARLTAQLERLRSDPENEAPRLLGRLEWPKIGNAGQAPNWRGGALKELREASKELVNFLETAPLAVTATVALEAALALDDFLAALEAAKARAGSVDFDDLLLRARGLLRSDPVARAELQRAITHLLVDEFQDTDPTQAEIIFLLAAADPAESDWRKTRPVPGKLFLVGDPKQSIYRFRRADITLYNECQRLLEAAGGVKETIEVNFRTLGPILAWVNELFDPLMAREPDPSLAAFRPPYALLLPFRPEDPAPQLPTVLRLALQPTGPTAGDRRADEAARLTGLARRLVEGGEGRVFDRGSGAWRAPLWGEIAVLFRAYSALRVYEDALREAGIPYRVEGGRLYYARSEVQALLAVLRTVDNPNDRLALVAALRSPFFAFRDDTLLMAHAAAPLSWAAETPPATAELADAFQQLADWHRRRHELGPARLVEEILAGRRALEFYSLKPDGEQRVANLLKIVDEARRFARDVGAVRAFLRHLAERSAATGSEAEGESPTQEEGERGHLHLLTIHKSKGLEYPIVILADPGHAGGGLAPRVLVDRASGRLALALSLNGTVARTPEWDDLALLEAAQAEAEEIRLFYVACTRARDLLILPRPSAGGKREGFLALLDRCEPAGGADIEAVPVAPEDGAPVFRLEVPPAPPGGNDPLAGAAQAFQAQRGALLAALPPPPRRIRPSALGHAARPAESGAPWGAAGAGAQLGALVHEVLEMDAPMPEAFAAALRRRLMDVGGTSVDAELVDALVAAAGASPIAPRLLRARVVRREAPFLSRHRLSDGRIVYLDGRVDLAFLEADGWVVVDYKTDRVPAGGVQELVDRYRGQALGYALGVTRSLLRTHDGLAAGTRAGDPALGVKEVALVFLRAGETRSLHVTPDLLAEAEERLVVAASEPEP